MERHQSYALGILAAVCGLVWLREGMSVALEKGAILVLFLVPIFLYRIIAFLSSFGFPEVFAKDYGSENHPGPYALFFWLLYLIACLFIIFDWRLN